MTPLTFSYVLSSFYHQIVAVVSKVHTLSETSVCALSRGRGVAADPLLALSVKLDF